MVDKPAAAREFAHARDMQRALPEPAATLMGYVNDRAVKPLGEALLPHIAIFEKDAVTLARIRARHHRARLSHSWRG